MMSFLWNLVCSLAIALLCFILYRLLPLSIRRSVAVAAIWVIEKIEASCSEGKADLQQARTRLTELRLLKKQADEEKKAS